MNERLERGETWIGDLLTKKDGVKVPSKFLYIQFYAGDEQKRINTKTNEGDNRRYTGLHPHDFRRSASRNLIKDTADAEAAVAGIR